MNRGIRRALPYLLVAPAVIYLLGITLYPFIYLVWQSLYESSLTRPGMAFWVGFDNYWRVFTDPTFWESLWNTFVIAGTALLIEFVIALGLALVAMRSNWVTPWRVIFITPMLFMPSAVSFMWKLMFFPGGSVINDVLNRLGLIAHQLDWFGNAYLARSMLIVADAWEWIPFLFLIFLAGLQAQSESLREASTLDGARWYDHIWHISLPLLKPVIAIGLTLRGIALVRMFTKVFVMTGGSPGGATETVSYFIYRIGFKEFSMGYASAMSVVVLVINIVVVQIILARYFQPQW